MTAFVDTSAFFAAVDVRDADHHAAVSLLSLDEPLVTSDHVLVETWSLVKRRFGPDVADRFWDGLRSGGASIEPVKPVDLERA